MRARRHPGAFGGASWSGLAVAAFCGACAAGADGPSTGAATSGDPTTTSASSAATGTTTSVGATTGGTSGTGGGQGGAAQGGGGATGGGGAGEGGLGGSGGQGTGGDPAGTGGLGGGGAGGEGTGGDGTGGSAPTGVVTLLAIGPTGGIGAVRDGAGRWSTDALTGTFSSSRPALAMLDESSALGLVRTSSDALHRTTWGGASWTTPTSVGGSTTTRDTPAMTSANGVAHATFHGVGDFRHYYARYAGSSFTLLGELVGGDVTPSFGPTAAAITVLGAEPIVAYAGNDDGLYGQPRGASTWQSAVAIALGGQTVDVTPALTTLAGDVPLVVAAAFSGSALVWSRRTGGVWAAAQPVAVDALSNDPPALAAISGGAVLAYRGTNGGVYASLFDAGSGSWTTPERVGGSASTPSTPDVATGVGSASAELAYIDAATGAANHVRRTGGSWGSPVEVGGAGLSGLAIATSP